MQTPSIVLLLLPNRHGWSAKHCRFNMYTFGPAGTKNMQFRRPINNKRQRFCQSCPCDAAPSASLMELKIQQARVMTATQSLHEGLSRIDLESSKDLEKLANGRLSL
jgi:hypothetical protein